MWSQEKSQNPFSPHLTYIMPFKFEYNLNIEVQNSNVFNHLDSPTQHCHKCLKSAHNLFSVWIQYQAKVWTAAKRARSSRAQTAGWSLRWHWLAPWGAERRGRRWHTAGTTAAPQTIGNNQRASHTSTEHAGLGLRGELHIYPKLTQISFFLFIHLYTMQAPAQPR